MQEKTPFIFGVKVEGDALTDRKEETERLKMNFTYGINTILISPRRMETINDFSVSLEHNAGNRTTEEVLQLPEMIAREKGIKVVVCIDEFQQIGDFSDSLTFQKKLRSVWQHQSNVTYCLYGSRKHMMEKMFQDPSYPFYRFGDIFYLKKISKEYWCEYICRKFSNSGKSISAELAGKICEVTDSYSSYVQQLAWFVWLRTDGIHTGFTQSSVLSSYRLGTTDRKRSHRGDRTPHIRNHRPNPETLAQEKGLEGLNIYLVPQRSITRPEAGAISSIAAPATILG